MNTGTFVAHEGCNLVMKPGNLGVDEGCNLGLKTR